MTAQLKDAGTSDSRHAASAADRTASGIQMPATVRRALFIVLSLVIAGGLYLLAVRGDALLADLSAIAALICG